MVWRQARRIRGRNKGRYPCGDLNAEVPVSNVAPAETPAVMKERNIPTVFGVDNFDRRWTLKSENDKSAETYMSGMVTLDLLSSCTTASFN